MSSFSETGSLPGNTLLTGSLPGNTLLTGSLPGNTLLPSDECFAPYPLISLKVPPSDKQIIVFGSNDVNDQTLFLNGLTQNILILYDLFESLGYLPYLLQHQSGSESQKKAFIHSYRTVTSQDMVKCGMRIKLFIEIGMSIDPLTRQYLRSTGAKITKLYLGNILNIDVETIQYYPSMFFNHHIVGELDEIWTSPHYRQHLDYAAILNRTEMEKAQVVPYVWDPCFLTRYHPKETLDWIPPTSWTQQDIVIMDPNISFQKCSFYSVLLVEAFSRKYPEWKGTLHVINGDRLKINSYAHNQLLPSLTLYAGNRIKLYGRKRIHEILLEHRSACFLTHQWNNDYNYMTLELMYCNYPILHNSEGWADYGYSYSINRWEESIDVLYRALHSHSESLSVYKAHTAHLIWKHSIYHPEIRKRWLERLQ